MKYITKSDYDAMLFKLKVIASTDIKVSSTDIKVSGEFPYYNHGLCGFERELWGEDYRFKEEGLICPLDLREKPSIHGCILGCAIEKNLPDQQIKQIIKDFIIKD